MSDQARVTSLEAIEHFRARLIVYRGKAGRVLDEISDEVLRTRVWLQQDCVTRREARLRRLARELEQQQQEHFTAKLSQLQEASTLQQAAVDKLRREIREIEAQLQLVKQWSRQFDHRVEPPARQVEKLRHLFDHDLGLAVAWLAEAVKTLVAYAELSPTSGPPPATTVDAEKGGPA